MFWSNKKNALTAVEQVNLRAAPEIAVSLRPSQRARRMSLRVSKLDGRVTLTIPYGASRREALEFAEARADWIRGHLSDTAPTLCPSIGDSIPYLGRLHPIVAAPVRAPRIVDAQILVPSSDPARTAARLEAFLKRAARDQLAQASDKYAAQVNRSFGRLTLRDTRSRWGSCSSEGNLMYSWRLILAPAEVLDYVAAHEVAHLVHMDHSPAFWSQVNAIYPGYEAPRKWLRDHGTQLHRYRFRE
ncbi:M48 family metallopeptidase [Aliiroseovarius sp. 2305UL8-7]|uniref:M48 family metallopeptidase n=1 Tax=Aliiroseovarius conchicola TaxID=3121637 RepID=UPI0035293064